MKIHTKIRIDIKTGEVLEDKSFEYAGEVAQCGGGKGGGSSVEYTQSPEQREMYELINPVVARLAGAATGGYWQETPGTWSDSGRGFIGRNGNMNYGQTYTPGTREWIESDAQSLYDIPDAPTAPTAPSMQNIPLYNIPDASMMMPSQDWWGSLSPEVMQGLWSPYNAGAQQMMETMGAGGNLGSARGGYSGTGENALGRFYSDAATDVGLQAWKMTQPAMMANWQAQLQRGQTGYGQAVQDYQNTLAQQQADYGMAQEDWRQQIAREQMPYGILPGLVGGTYSTPVVEPSSGGIGSALTGAGAGWGTAAMAGLGPWGMAGMAGLGLLGGK